MTVFSIKFSLSLPIVSHFADITFSVERGNMHLSGMDIPFKSLIIYKFCRLESKLGTGLL